jgi:hypothetical protein
MLDEAGQAKLVDPAPEQADATLALALPVEEIALKARHRGSIGLGTRAGS